MNSVKKEGGFTLIEVVVAFVLLALVLATAFEIFSTGFSRAADLDDYSRALVVAQSQLAAAGTEETLKEGETQGDSEDRRFHWWVAIKRTEDGADPSMAPSSTYALYRIDVRVTWRGADTRDHALSLATLAVWTRA